MYDIPVTQDYRASEMYTVRPSLGSIEGRILSTLDLEEIAILNVEQHRYLFPNLDDAAWRHAIERLTAKGWLEPIRRGRYLVVPRAGVMGWEEHPFLIAAAIATHDYYVSFWSALVHYGLTEQRPRVVYIAQSKGRSAEHRFKHWRYRIVRLPPRRFFGRRREMIRDHPVWLAELEKALLDSLYQERYGGGIVEIAKALARAAERIDTIRLTDYAVQMDSAPLCRRLGYLMEAIGLPDAERLQPHLGRTSQVYLSRLLPKRPAFFDKRWRLRVNVTQEDLLSWRETW